MNIKLRKGCVAFVSAALCLLFISSFLPVYAGELPEPTADFYVNDYAEVLSKETEEHIVELNDTLYSLTGAQVVVVARDFLDGMAIEDYGYQLFNQWEIGSGDKDNGVLLLLAIGEDDYWITLGRGSESILSMNYLTSVRDRYLEDAFSAGDYDRAVSDTVDAIAGKLAEHYGVSLDTNVSLPQEEPEKIGESSLLTLIIILIVVASVFGGFFRSYCPPRRPRWWMNPPPPPPPIHGPGRPRYPGGPRPPEGPGPGGFGGFGPPRSGGGFGGFSGGGRSGGGRSGGGRSGGGGSSRGGGMGRK